MKRFQTQYSENSITYWPISEGGRIGIILFVVLGAVFIVTSIWGLLDDPSRKTCLEILLTLLLAVAALSAMITLILQIMYTKIVISEDGIAYYRYNNSVEKQVKWEDVSAVYFDQELWYGSKLCRVFLKEALSPNLHKKNKDGFVLPVYSVDEQALLQLIPQHLWKNKPWYS